MIEHVTAWLEAYYDDELVGRRVRQVEAHLAECAMCRAQLEELGRLSALLQESPKAVEITSSERFVAQVGLRVAQDDRLRVAQDDGLRLPSRPERHPWRRGLEIGWQLTPVLLVGAWAFVQAVFIVTSFILLGLQVGLGGDLAAGLLPAERQGLTLAEVIGNPGAGLNNVGRIALDLVGSGGPLGWGVALNLAALLTICLLYWSWLASWWVRDQGQQH
jgi:hypothetical protein